MSTAGNIQQQTGESARLQPSGTGGHVTLQDEGEDVVELQLAVLHVCLDVLAHQGPAGLIAHISAGVSCRRRLLCNYSRTCCLRRHAAAGAGGVGG